VALWKIDDAIALKSENRFSLESVFKTAAIDDRGFRCALYEIDNFSESIFLVVDNDIDIGAANAQCIDLSIEVFEHLGERLHVAVRANAFDGEGLAQYLQFVLFIALAGAEADADDSLHSSVHRQDFDLDVDASGKAGGGDGGSGGRVLAKELAVDLVHGGEMVHGGQENAGFDHILRGQPSGFEESIDVAEDLLGLGLDIALDEFASGGEGDLAAEENEPPFGADPLAVGADSRRGVGSRNNLSGHALKVTDL